MDKLAGLKLKNAYDLRTAEEREKRPEELPPDVNYVVLDVLADSPQEGAAQLETLMQDPARANAALGGGKVEEMFGQSYREFVSLPSAQRGFRKLFVGLGDRAAGGDKDIPLAILGVKKEYLDAALDEMETKYGHDSPARVYLATTIFRLRTSPSASSRTR